MDIRMPRLDGIEATRRLTSTEGDAIRVLILTTFGLDDYVYWRTSRAWSHPAGPAEAPARAGPASAGVGS
jgi:CheY-like chemotaxis protein